MRRFAISDIHACYHTFQSLLAEIGLNKKDQLFILGDLINKGTYSKQVIDLIWSLQDQGYQVQVLKGNHEQYLLDSSYLTPPSERKRAFVPSLFLKSFGLNSLDEVPGRYLEWMQALPNYIILPDYILVHAGLNFSQSNPLEDYRSMQTIRSWYDDLDRDYLSGKVVVHGHTPTVLSTIQLSLSRLEEVPAINIDNGAVFPDMGLGHLVALDLDQRVLHATPRHRSDKAQGDYF